jgi:hypothetical protein
MSYIDLLIENLAKKILTPLNGIFDATLPGNFALDENKNALFSHRAHFALFMGKAAHSLPDFF